MSDSPSAVGHVHLKVEDVERALDFYTEVLGMELSERYGRFAFLTWGERHHDVALQAVGPDAPEPAHGIGLYHAAFEVDGPEGLVGVYDRLRERAIPVTTVDHGISKALYFDDPDGNGLEVYWDTRETTDETWEGRNGSFDPDEL